MGITYLMSWAAGVSSSPFSGMHLAMQGRFGTDSRGFLRWNGSFTLLMLAIDVGAASVPGDGSVRLAAPGGGCNRRRPSPTEGINGNSGC